ncbi:MULTISPECIES: hypothetical protein [unclassified Bradyrhizobium]|uniref:hypothetical protein n=1 Tax=unclassified Bradyrhizobium TaxID=2631580 RepID=UPI001FF7D15B|nr:MULTISPECIES: hypothetical protein [unclassified Bradyrhizobium]MCK1551526.1 hypothetical protein [Bradyrhizobium sp. 177]UPJ29875.1 hypothetical protein IVB54_13130 [Bradyrhizobium sp. CW1]UPJ82781.1 hypothetical protein IVB17_12960 [Bradyrhizobium sp. 184]UPJ90573.1 hypothetical protein IVB16_12960 [Bradyrhizobium sp. 183]
MIIPYELGVWQRAILLYACSTICCISLFCVAARYPAFHITNHPIWLFRAALATLAFASLSWLFAIARFSFGYLIGFYLYVMVLGYLWLNSFSPLPYNHALTGASAAASAASFLLPALFICAPLRQMCALSIRSVDRLLTAILVAAIATIAAGVSYNFKFVEIGNIYQFRGALAFPTALNYAMGIVGTALLPFAYACFALRGSFWRAGLVIVLMLLLYPITLTKMTLFGPIWLVVLTIASRLIESRATVILSLLVPISVGVLFFALGDRGLQALDAPSAYFGLVNFRMAAIPSLAMDYYNFFFATHELTNFCQIRLLSALIGCPYQEALGTVMNKFFGFGGYFNASLFATEGIASVGPTFAPLTALACGLFIAIGNRLAAGLPDRFILLSSGVLAQAFLNIPFTTTLLSQGAGFMILLWYLMPRKMFEPDSKDLCQ